VKEVENKEGRKTKTKRKAKAKAKAKKTIPDRRPKRLIMAKGESCSPSIILNTGIDEETTHS
jgi:hypothetical protein